MAKASKEAKSNLRELMEAAKAVIERHNPQTLGPCQYCEWPITKCCCGTWSGESWLVCDLCLKFTDTIFCRQFWVDYPANVI